MATLICVSKRGLRRDLLASYARVPARRASAAAPRTKTELRGRFLGTRPFAVGAMVACGYILRFLTISYESAVQKLVATFAVGSSAPLYVVATPCAVSKVVSVLCHRILLFFGWYA